MSNRNLRSRQELALLVWTAIDGEVKEIRAYAAVVQESVALTGRAVAHNALPVALCRDQEVEQIALRCLDLGRERAIVLERQQTRIDLALTEGASTCRK